MLCDAPRDSLRWNYLQARLAIGPTSFANPRLAPSTQKATTNPKMPLRQLADEIIRLSERYRSTPVLVTPTYLSLRKPILLGIGWDAR